MKKLLFLILLLPMLCYGQTTVTLNFKAQNPGTSHLDPLLYTYTGKYGGYDSLYNAYTLRSLFLQKIDSARYVTPYYLLNANIPFRGTPTFTNGFISNGASTINALLTVGQFYANGSDNSGNLNSDFSWDHGNGFQVFNGNRIQFESTTIPSDGDHYFHESGTSLFLTPIGNTHHLEFTNNSNIKDETGNFFLKGHGDSSTYTHAQVDSIINSIYAGNHTYTGQQIFTNHTTKFGDSIAYIQNYNANGTQDNLAGWKFNVGGDQLSFRFQPDTFGATRFGVFDETGNVGAIAYVGDVNKIDTIVNSKADTVTSVFQNGDKTNFYEKTKAAAPTIRNIYIKPFSAGVLNIGFNYDDGYTTEYTMSRDDDSLLRVTGANVGPTVPYGTTAIGLFGTFLTGTVNSYTVTTGDTFTFSFNGNGFSLNTFKDNRGGVWDFYIPAVSKHVQVSMYNATTISSITVPIVSGLPENNYTVIATFMGADPLNPPSGGIARGWFKYSATSPQTIKYTTLTGVMSGANVSMLSPGAVIETALSLRKLGATGTDTLFKFFPEHSSITGTTRNLKIRLNVDERILTRPDSITSLITGIKKIAITQDGDVYYPTGSTKFFSFNWVHTFDSGQLSFGNSITSKSDSVQMASSYINLLAATVPSVNKITVGDTSYAIPSGVSQTIHFGKPSGNILFTGSASGNNYAIAQHANLLTAFDYPRQKYTDTSMFMQTNSTVAKVYYNVSPFLPSFRTIKNGMAFSDLRQIYIVRTPSTIQEPQVAAGVPIAQPIAGGTGSNKTPTGGQVLVGQNSGIFTPKTLIGAIAIDTAGKASFSPSYPHTIFTPTTGATITLVNHQYNVVNPVGSIATLTFVMPTSPVNGDALFVKFTQPVTTITWPSSVKGAAITTAADANITLLYDSASGFWY